MVKNIQEYKEKEKGFFKCPFDYCFEIFLPLIALSWSWTYDMPMTLSTPLREANGLTDEQIEDLYSGYSLASQFMCIPIGFIIRKKGTCFIYLISLVGIIGHVIFCIGVNMSNFPVMQVGRIINGCGSETMFISISYLMKLYIKEKNLFMVNCIMFITSRVIYATQYYIDPEIYILTKSFNYILILSIIVLLISFISFTIYYSFAKKYCKANQIEAMKDFKCKDLKKFSSKVYLVLGLEVFTWGVYWVFQAMFMQFLQEDCGVSYRDSKNMLTVFPIISMLVIQLLLFMPSDKLNEAKLIFVSSLMVFFAMSVIPMVGGKGYYFGYLIQVSQAIAGGIFVSSLFPFIAKNVSVDLFAICLSIAIALNNFAVMVGSLVTGRIMGEKAKAPQIHICCMFLSGCAFIGVLQTISILYLESIPEDKTKSNEEIQGEHDDCKSLINEEQKDIAHKKGKIDILSTGSDENSVHSNSTKINI